MSGLPKEAKKAARGAVLQVGIPRHLDVALTAAYPIIRRAVIAEVVDALRERDAQHNGSPKCLDVAADFIEREFGSTQDERCEDCGGTGERVLNAFWPKGTEAHMEKCSTCGGSGKRS